jgi:serine/threonine protein kinase/predicted RNA polymerase sigma factor
MSEVKGSDSQGLTGAYARQEQLLEAFEAAWRRGERPAVEDYLPKDAADPELLLDLLHVDLEYRLQAGEPARAEEYLTRFPEAAGDPAFALALIAREYQLRQRREPGLDAREYVDRFPQFRDELAQYLSPVQGEVPRAAPPAEVTPAEPDTVPPGLPSPEGTGDDLASRKPPAVARPTYPAIPGFEILDILGRGGMGVVYKARQLRLNRLVALKMILAGPHAGPEELNRFRREAEAVAQLQHPHIVQIHEIGEHDGRPYCALEFVDGGTLAQQLAGTPLPPRQAAALAETLARAVHAAHEKNIIHRDLKPANVLLTPGGVPKLTDFGLAKRLDVDTAHTQSGAIMGTPSYMAPEQAAGSTGQIGPRTDVYALGAILYEMLTGRPPFRGASVLDTLEQVRRDDPVAPRQLQPKLPRDLETICLKCLQKEPGKRYASALELADDLARFLKGEPIRARPIPGWERGLKWSRRRPALAFLIFVLAVPIPVSLIMMVGLWRQATTARDEARESARAESQAKRRTRQVLDAISSQVIDNWLSRQPGKLQPDQEEFLKTALASYRQFAQESGEGEEVRAGVALAHARVGDISARLGQSNAAEEAYRRAITYYEGLAADFPAVPSYRHESAGVHNNLGNLLADLGKHADAQAAYRRAITLREKLAVEVPTVPKYRLELAQSHQNQGRLLADLGKHAEAETAYRQTNALYQQLAAEFPAGAQYRWGLAANYINLGLLLGEVGKYAEAQGAFHQAIPLLEKLAAEFPAAPQYRYDLARSHNNLGMLLAQLGKRPEAEVADRQAISLQQNLAAEFPAVPEYRKGLAMSHNNLGNLLRDLGKHPEAEGAYRQAVALQEQLAAEFPAAPDYRWVLAVSHTNLGVLLQNLGRHPEAEAAYRRAFALHQNLAAEFPAVPTYRQGVAVSHINLGALLEGMGKHRAAEAAFRQAVALQEQLAAEFPAASTYRVELAASEMNLGTSLVSQQRPAEALPWFERAVALLEPLHQQEPRDVRTRDFLRNAFSSRAEALANLQHHVEALADWDRAVELSSQAERPAMQLRRASSHAKAGKVATAVADAEALTKDPATPGPTLYDAACVYALAGTASKGEGKQQGVYASQAFSLLRRAQTTGYFKDPKQVERLKKDSELEALRSHPAFQKLLAELEHKKNNAK